jgi:hypothetical protein
LCSVAADGRHASADRPDRGLARVRSSSSHAHHHRGIAGHSGAARVLLAGRRHEFSVALSGVAAWVLAVTVLLQIAALVARSEAWAGADHIWSRVLRSRARSRTTADT